MFYHHNLKMIIGVLVLIILIIALACVIAFNGNNGGDDGFDDHSDHDSILNSLTDCRHQLPSDIGTGSECENTDHHDKKSNSGFDKKNRPKGFGRHYHK